MNARTLHESDLSQTAAQQAAPPYFPLSQWSTIEDHALDGAVTSQMAFSNTGDLYYGFAQSVYYMDSPRGGLPALHLRFIPHGELTESELSVPPLPTNAATASLLALKTDSAGNLYYLYTANANGTDSTLFYRYASGSGTPAAVTLPPGFLLSTRAGAGLYVDRLSGKLYFAGTHITAANSVAALAISSDGGATWSIHDASAVTGTQAFGAGTDLSGDLYLAGAKPLGASGTSWVVYRSSDGGTTFSEVDSAAPTSAAANAAARAEYVAIDGFGRIVVAGTDVTDPANQGSAVVVRESSDQGATFQEKARFQAKQYPAPSVDSTPGFVVPRGLALGPAGMSVIPIREEKRPSAYLFFESPGLDTWTTALGITNLNDGEPDMQASDFDPVSGTLYLLTEYLNYSARTSTLRLTRFNP
jgi:hypothetical protein